MEISSDVVPAFIVARYRDRYGTSMAIVPWLMAESPSDLTDNGHIIWIPALSLG